MCSENVLINGAGRGVLGGFGFSKVIDISRMLNRVLINATIGALCLGWPVDLTSHWSTIGHNLLSGRTS